MNTLKKTWEFVNGYKTYFFAAAMVVIAGLYAQGYIDEQMFKALEAVFGGGALASMRHAVAK